MEQYFAKLRDQICEAFDKDKLDDTLFYFGQYLRAQKRTISVSTLRHLPLNDSPYEILSGYCLNEDQKRDFSINGIGDYFIIMRDGRIIGAERLDLNEHAPDFDKKLEEKMNVLIDYHSPFHHAFILIAYHQNGILTNWQSPLQYRYQNPLRFGAA